MFDTVAVFAFYTDEIMVSGGPESITGLPGMILGVGIPKTFTTWFATQVSLQPNLKSIVPPGKGKKSTRQEMFSKINQLAKRWGSEGAFLSMIYSL